MSDRFKRWRRGTVVAETALLGLAGSFAGLAGQAVPTLQLQPEDARVERGFTMITSIRELPDGRVLVADWGENRLYLADLESDEVVAVGQEGEGPGEYSRIAWIYPMGGDSTLLTDGTTRRWLVLAETRFVGTVGPTDPLRLHLSTTARLDGVDESGRVLAARRHRGTPGSPDSLVLVLGDRGSGAVDTVAVLAGPGEWGRMAMIRGGGAGRGEGGGGGVHANPVYAPEQALLLPDGWIAVARLEPFRVDWRSGAGEWTVGPRLPFPSVPLGDGEKCAALARSGLDCAVADDFGWPDALPPFISYRETPQGNGAGTATLFATPEGHVLIRRTESSEGGTRYVVVDRDGAARARLHLADNEAVVGFGRASVYVIETDALDLQHLRRHPWRPPPRIP